MPHITDRTSKHIIAGSTPRIEYDMEKEDGTPLTVALTTQLATIYDVGTQQALSGWTDKDINGANGNLVTSGAGIWDLPAEATAMITANAEVEDHIIAMHATYGAGRVLKHDIKIQVHRRLVGT